MIKKISLVIPCYNESDNIESFNSSLINVIAGLPNYEFEIIYVNDGSKDNTRDKIASLCMHDDNILGINFSRNFGKEIALTAGIDYATGDAIITLDGDGQHPVSKLPDFIREWENGYQIVYNVRPKNHGASKLKRLTSYFFYKLFNLFSEFELEQNSTDYRLIDRKVADYFLKFSEKNRMYRGIIDWIGFEKKALEFDALERISGKGTYSYKKLWSLAINSLTSFSVVPLKLVGYLGFLMTTVSGLLFTFVLIDKFTVDRFQFSNIAAILLVNTVLIGIVLMSLGLIALYIARIHEEVQGRPMYIIDDVLNKK